jgi:hypothetical protein
MVDQPIFPAENLKAPRHSRSIAAVAAGPSVFAVLAILTVSPRFAVLRHDTEQSLSGIPNRSDYRVAVCALSVNAVTRPW